MLYLLKYSDIVLSVINVLILLGTLRISYKTLKQNSEMIHDSTRPYLALFVTQISLHGLHHYIILKNFGSTSAKITKFETDFDWGKVDYSQSSIPFSNVVGSTLAPSQKLFTQLDGDKMRDFSNKWYENHNEPFLFDVWIEYQSPSGRSYKENISVSLFQSKGLIQTNPSTRNDPDKSLQNISTGLMRLIERLF